MESPSFVGSLPRFALSVLEALAVFVLPAYLAAGDLVIANSGHSSYRIVVPEGATSAIGYAAAELQRFVWNLRYDDPVKVPGAFYSNGEPHGPLVVPGQYLVKLTAEGKTQSATLGVLADPRVKTADGDLQKQFELSSDVYRQINRMREAINAIRDLKSQVRSLRGRLENDPKLAPVLTAAADLENKLSLVEGELIQVNMKGSEANLAFPNMLNEQFDSFSGSVEAADAAPTEQQYGVFKMLTARLEEQLKALDGILATDLPAFEETARRHNVTLLWVPKARH